MSFLDGLNWWRHPDHSHPCLRLPHDAAQGPGTSLGALFAPIGLLAFMEYYKAGNVDLRAAVMIAVGFRVGGYFGGRWAQLLTKGTVRRGFAVMLIVVGIGMQMQK